MVTDVSWLEKHCPKVYTCISYRFMFMFIRVFKCRNVHLLMGQRVGCLRLVGLLETPLSWYVTIYISLMLVGIY